MNDPPGAATDSQLRELGESLVERTGRLATDVSHNNEQIAMLQSKITKVAMGVAIISCGGVFIIVVTLLW